MTTIDYSVIIRTTGKAKEKYASLLKSIAQLDPQPKAVIVVLPDGYELPEERLGWERFFFSPMGMVIQRMTGIAHCQTRYALVCDDDVQFGPDFVRKLHEPVARGDYGFSVGPLYAFLPAKGGKALADLLMGNAVPTIFHTDRYVSTLRTTGYSYNRHLEAEKRRYYETQAAAWTCFYADMEALRSIDFEAEQQWLDSHGYSALDDQTMFYKAWLRGWKTVVVPDAVYQHLDARTSTRDHREPVLYSRIFNRVVYWHRFVFRQERHFLGKLWAAICLGYRMAWIGIYDVLDLLRKRIGINEMKIRAKAFRDAWKYLKTEAYQSLPPVR